MKRKTFVLMLAALAAASTATATTYVRVEKDGSKTYSDRPIPGGQPVNLEPAQTYSAPRPANTGNSSVSPETRLVQQMDNFQYESCELTPKKDEQFTNPQSVNIAVSFRPLLRSEDVVHLTVDGVALPDSISSYALSPANRGTHTVSVQVKDGYGRSVCAASTVFHVFQPGLNSPARRAQQAPPKK